jgi:lipid-A-disaccharide synthase
MALLSVNGYVEVLKRLPSLLRLRRALIQKIKQLQPDLYIGIDAPDFNLGVELALKKAGICTVHYVSPSIWAWRFERIHKIAAATHHVLTLFPFEAPLYHTHRIPATYVGHPLADTLPLVPNRAAVRRQFQLPADLPIYALLPGSRMNEVRQLGRLLIQTARCIVEKQPDARFLVPLVNRETFDLFENLLHMEQAYSLAITPMFGHAVEAMIAADGVILASGTATLEAALLKRPMVITYTVPPLTYRMVKRKMLIPYFGLPNMLAQGFVVPELIQDDATPENLAQALLNQVRDTDLVEKLTVHFTQMHHLLKQNNAERAADAIEKILHARES